MQKRQCGESAAHIFEPSTSDPLPASPLPPRPRPHSKRPDHLGGATPLTKEALANIIDKLLQSREEQREAAAAAATAAQRHPAPRMSPSGGLAAFVGGEPLASPTFGAGPASDDGSTGGSVGRRNDTALWEEATAMLRGELIRLGREAAQKMEVRA